MYPFLHFILTELEENWRGILLKLTHAGTFVTAFEKTNHVCTKTEIFFTVYYNNYTESLSRYSDNVPYSTKLRQLKTLVDPPIQTFWQKNFGGWWQQIIFISVHWVNCCVAPWRWCLFKLFQLNRWFVATTNTKFSGIIHLWEIY